VLTSVRSILIRVLSLLLIPTVSVLLIGAGEQLDSAWARLQGYSNSRRKQLEDTLKRFEQLLSNDQQASVRDLDRKISGLTFEQKAHYLSTLRKYHNWLGSLPETVKDGLLAKPPAERMAQIKSLVAKYPVPREDTPSWMKLAAAGTGTPLELAVVFKIWQEMTPDQRKQTEGLPVGERKIDVLLRNGHAAKLIRELRPSDFDEQEWVLKAESRLRELLPFDPELKEAIAKKQTAADDVMPRRKSQEAVEKARTARLRRQAFNFYFQEHPPRTVDPERLAQFFDALPSWTRDIFRSSPPDEARRRLTAAYRLVFPYPQEYRPTAAPRQSSGAVAASKRAIAAPSPSPTDPRKEKTAPKSSSPAPF
jgi:hypothetical protein